MPDAQRSPTSCADAHPAGESIDEKYWYLPAFDKTVVAFLQSYGRLPMETRSKDAEERRLAVQIRKHRGQLHPDTRELLDALEDPAGCAALARSDLKRLASQSTGPPDDLKRKVELMTKIPSLQALLKEQYLPYAQSAAPAAMQAPGTFFRKRLRQKTTVPNDGVQHASTPASSSTIGAVNRGLKRRLDDTDGLMRVIRSRSSDDVHLAAEAVTHSMDGQADVALLPKR